MALPSSGDATVRSIQIPSSQVAPEFGEVNLRRSGSATEVAFTVLMEPEGTESEGWQTGVAIDASKSMQGAFGRGVVPCGDGKLPDPLVAEYTRRGWIRTATVQGKQNRHLTDEGRADLVARGIFAWTPNSIEPQAQ